MDDVVIGCCGWPEARQRYFSHLGAVELQDTFYDPPSPQRASRLRQEAPPGFVVTMKAWQLITHPPTSPTYRRLRRGLPAEAREEAGLFRPTATVRWAWQETLAVARAVGAMAIVFQCPPSFRPTPENKGHLQDFFQQVEREGRILAWEPRGPWPPEEVMALCRELGLVHCVDPLAQGLPLWGEAAYLRLHGRGGYRYRYSDRELAELAQICERLLAQGRRPVLVMFNNTNMLEDALRFQAMLG